MTARSRLDSARLSLTALAVVRALAVGGGAAFAIAALLHLAVAPGGGVIVTAVVLGVALALWVFRAAGATGLSVTRTALWIEERHPELQYALVTAAESADPHLQASLARVDWSADLRDAWRRGLVLAVATLAGGLMLWLLSARVALPARLADRRASSRSPLAGSTPLHLRVEVAPPPYSRLPSQSLENPPAVRALAGSALLITAGDPTATFVPQGTLQPPGAVSGRGSLRLRMPPASSALLIAGQGGRRLLALDAVADSVPQVRLLSPAHDSVLRVAGGTLALGAELRDDFGLAQGAFEYIVSSGEGESFTFKSGRIGAASLGGDREATLRDRLQLADLQLKPGDLVHVRAVARDVNVVTGPGNGFSETRTIRIARPGEYDSVAVEAAAPAEADKSAISERMLINLAEALVARRKTLAREPYVGESQRIGRDQSRLRRQVGDIIFSRLGAEPQGEEVRDVDREDRPLTKEDLLKAAEAATQSGSTTLDFEQDESPVVAVNRPLLEAYNAMWDAGRSLSIGEPDNALPHMRRALAAIQRARAAERLYLRGKLPRAVVDVAKVRLQGKEKGTPAARTPRVAADSAVDLARMRFSRVLDLLATRPSEAVDSLLMLRLSVMQDVPVAARELDTAIEALRTGRDATAPLGRARRALDRSWSVRDSVSRWGGGAFP
jgi:hypothetical protein